MPIFIKVGDIMNRIKNQLITYDSNLIIYYCFSTKNHEIIELTSKTKKLTEYLINNNSEIILPQFIIDEIKNITFSEIVFNYITKRSEVTHLPKNPTYLFRIELEGKIRKKFEKFLKREWITIDEYCPTEKSINQIEESYSTICNEPKSKEFLRLKKTDTIKPSLIDIKLIAFSKEKNTTLISNDYDITYFSKELIEKNLAHQIFNLKELIIYN